MRKLPMTLTALAALVAAGTVQAQEPYPQQQDRQQQQQQHQQHEQDSIKGQVVEASENELTVRAEDGRTMTFKVDDQTRVTDPAGRAADAEERERIEDLRTGENVVVKFRDGDTPEEKVAVAVEIRDDDDRPGAHARTQERDVTERDRDRDVTERDRQQERTQQQRQQQQRQQQERQQQERGQQAQESIQGQIVEVSDDELTVRTQEGRSMTFKVDERTRVMDPAGRATDDEQRDSVEDLREGENVMVRYRTGDTPTEHIAVAIEIRDRDEAGTPPAQQQQQERAQQQAQQQQERTQQQRMQEQERTQQQQTQQQQRTQQQMQQQQQELPRTSSSLPLVALMGLIGMIGAAGAASWAVHRG